MKLRTTSTRKAAEKKEKTATKATRCCRDARPGVPEITWTPRRVGELQTQTELCKWTLSRLPRLLAYLHAHGHWRPDTHLPISDVSHMVCFLSSKCMCKFVGKARNDSWRHLSDFQQSARFQSFDAVLHALATHASVDLYTQVVAQRQAHLPSIWISLLRISP